MGIFKGGMEKRVRDLLAEPAPDIDEPIVHAPDETDPSRLLEDGPSVVDEVVGPAGLKAALEAKKRRLQEGAVATYLRAQIPRP